MSTIPVPKPRALAQDKRPVPLPRTNIPKATSPPKTDSQSTLPKLKNATKQFVDDIKGVITEKVDIHRQNSRRRRKSAQNQDENELQTQKETQEAQSPDIFRGIHFESPITISQSSPDSSYIEENDMYHNLNSLNETDNASSSEEFERPPPNYTPPPPPDVSTYDTPSTLQRRNVPSIPIQIPNEPPPTPTRPKPTFTIPPPPICDSPPVVPARGDRSVPNTPSRIVEDRPKYESVFPMPPVCTDSESDGSRTGTLDKTECMRPESWNFYDPVTLNDPVYMNELSLRRNDNRSSDSESSVNSELSRAYENHILELHRRHELPGLPQRPPRPSKSTIIEFDPLLATSNPPMIALNPETKMLDEIFQQDLYGTNNIPPNYDQCSISGDSETGEEFLNPPTPPQRSDSLMEEVPNTSNKRTIWHTETKNEVPEQETKKHNFISKITDGMEKVLKRVPEYSKGIRAGLHKDKFIDRPALNARAIYQHKGILFRVSSKSVEDLFGEFHFRWLVLANGQMTFYADNACENPKEHIPLETVLSIQFAPEKKYKLETELYCFELNTTANRSRGGYVYGIATIQECKHWMQRIAEALTNRFPVNVIMEYTRMGWAYLREGISGTWTGAWIVLSRRHLYYAQDGVPMGSIDLRKARCIQLQDPDSEPPRTNDSKGPNLIIDSQESTVYLRMWTARETKLWCHFTQTLAYQNGRKLEQQQLTKDDVPVIVEKCFNFVYVNGSMSEGVYRRSGSNSTVNDVLKQFQKNAWAVSLTTEKYNEHDIANVIKRFFRDLPEPLLTEEKSKYLCQIANAFAENIDKIKMYKAILDQFPKVVYCTLKRLLGHLHFIQSQSEKNKMNTLNLASIWGPTLIHLTGSDIGETNSSLTKLLQQLIDLYKNLFPITPEELQREKLMLQVLERNFNRQGPQHIRASGDLRVYVHLWDKSGEAINVTIGPQKLAADVCMELSSKMNIPAFELQLEELVLNDALRRPIHYSERVLDVVLRWGYWDEPDRKDNCLVLTTMGKYKPFDKSSNSLIFSEELKFADTKTKSFKSFIFKFEQAKLCYYKEAKQNVQVKIQEWNIEDILWYFGFEPRHFPQTKWAMTFILKKIPPKRTKVSPYFGNTIGGNDTNMRNKLVSTMIRTEYSNGLAPPLMNIPAS